MLKCLIPHVCGDSGVDGASYDCAYSEQDGFLHGLAGERDAEALEGLFCRQQRVPSAAAILPSHPLEMSAESLHLRTFLHVASPASHSQGYGQVGSFLRLHIRFEDIEQSVAHVDVEPYL